MLRAFVSSLLLLLCAGVRAQESCPWLTVGTAEALLGGAVSASTHVSAGEGSCDFARDADAARSATGAGSDLVLKIAVGHQLPKECATGEPLTGIGEDSVWCAMDAGRERVGIIRGRVRTTYFLLTLTGTAASAQETASIKSVLERAAEEVAGSLF